MLPGKELRLAFTEKEDLAAANAVAIAGSADNPFIALLRGEREFTTTEIMILAIDNRPPIEGTGLP